MMTFVKHIVHTNR